MQGKGKFAVDTTVSPEKSLDEIRQLLKRYDAKSKFGMVEDETQVSLAFELKGRRVRFVLPLPSQKEAIWQENNRYHNRGDFDQNLYEQLIRSRWRGLALVIKAKLEAVELGIETFDEAFMAQIVLPSGETAGEWMIPQIKIAYDTGAMPPLLPSGGR